MTGAKFVSFQPRASWKRMWRRVDPAWTRELTSPGELQWFEFSRDALYLAFRALAPASDTASFRSTHGETTPPIVWMPSFHCGMEVRAAMDAGFTPRFYPIRQDLTLDFDSLRDGLRRQPGPVLLIHYFGFAQPQTVDVQRLCRELQVAMVEDVSHGLFSHHLGQPLGTFGELATFSPYKSLGTMDGGLLRIDPRGFEHVRGEAWTQLPAPAQRLWPADAYFEALRRGLIGPSWLRSRQHRRYTAADAEAFESRVERSRRRIFDLPRRYGAGISRLSKRLIMTCDPRRIVERRRAAWQRLDRMLSGSPAYQPVYPGPLPAGVCPLYLPILTANRQALWLDLEQRGIRPFVFGYFHHPTLDVDAFPEARRLRDELLCLPVHQDLTTDELDWLGGEVVEALHGARSNQR